ncbi:MAG: glutamate 5-kinase, partial [Bacteroidaceae bacterium]|nr:glutamate 5-kinase [Bacteroidaceae bacterium]
GVTQVKGDFEEGDIVSIIDPQGQRIGIGRSAYSSHEAILAIGKHDVKPIIHYDYLSID